MNIEDTKPIDVLASRIWSGTHWHYPHIETMAAELTALRAALALLGAECNKWRQHAIDKEDTGEDHHGRYLTLREIYRDGNGADAVAILQAMQATDSSPTAAAAVKGST